MDGCPDSGPRRKQRHACSGSARRPPERAGRPRSSTLGPHRQGLLAQPAQAKPPAPNGRQLRKARTAPTGSCSRRARR
eukprot:8562549-Alexandrium_andersonii.AAC.1